MPHPEDGVYRLDGFSLRESDSPRAALDSIRYDDPLLHEVGRRADKKGRVTVNGHKNWLIESVTYKAIENACDGRVHNARVILFSEYDLLGRPLEIA